MASLACLVAVTGVHLVGRDIDKLIETSKIKLARTTLEFSEKIDTVYDHSVGHMTPGST